MTTTWTDRPLLGFDTETTGVDVDHDRIVTAALVHRDGRGTRVRTWLIDPGVPIPEAASAIHGISTDHAREHGQAPAEALDQIAAELATAMTDGVPVVAYNASFDLCLLEAELARYGLPTMSDRIGGELRPVIDPLVLDRAEDRYRRGKRKLIDLCGVYQVADTGRLHTADVDVVATLDVLDRIVDRFPHLGEKPLADLHDYQVLAHRAWAEGFNRWRASRGMTGEDATTAWPVPMTRLPPAAAPAPPEEATPEPEARPGSIPGPAAEPAVAAQAGAPAVDPPGTLPAPAIPEPPSGRPVQDTLIA